MTVRQAKGCRCIADVLQVTAMALCKHNKNNMLVCKLSKYWRHHRPDELFHTYSQIPVEALEVILPLHIPAYICNCLLCLLYRMVSVNCYSLVDSPDEFPW